MLDHVSVRCADANATFCDAVLMPLGGARLMELGELTGDGVPSMPDSRIGPLQAGAAFRRSHPAFGATDRATVDQFHVAAQKPSAGVLHEHPASLVEHRIRLSAMRT